MKLQDATLDICIACVNPQGIKKVKIQIKNGHILLL
jgi:hypothetical protein